MDVGLAMTARNHPDQMRPLTEIYREVLDEAVLGEQLGFRSWWLAEHHFAEDQHNPSQFPLLAAAAARTSVIRLGPYVLLLPLHNPLRVAEDAASVDILSGGRLELVIGAGPMPGECAVFGLDPKESFGRTYEALDVIGKCFTEDEFSHEGKYFTFRDVRMTTKPVQQPGPRIYLAALGPQSLTRAGERGYSLGSMVHTPLYPRYLEAQAAAGGPAPTSGCCPGRWPCTSRTPRTRPGTRQNAGCTGGSSSTGAGACRCRWPRWASCATTRRRLSTACRSRWARPDRSSRSSAPTGICRWMRWPSSSTIRAWIRGRWRPACGCSPPS